MRVPAFGAVVLIQNAQDKTPQIAIKITFAIQETHEFRTPESRLETWLFS